MPAKRDIPLINPKFACFPLEIRRSRIERYGVFAQVPIPLGKRVIEYAGERITERESMRRALRMFRAGKAERIYSARLDRRWKIDGSVGGSGAEFINHSCDPNLTMRRLRGQIFLYSFKKIKAGEELTVDYGFRCSCPCRCGSKKCRGTMCHL